MDISAIVSQDGTLFQVIRNAKALDIKITYKTSVDLAYAASDVATITSKDQKHLIIQTNCFEILGAGGVMPLPYTEQVIQGVKDKNESLLSFLNIFHHRLVETLYQAWSTRRMYVDDESNRFKKIFNALGALSQETEWHFALPYLLGFNGVSRSAEHLARILTDIFSTTIQVKEFPFATTTLPDTEVSKIGARGQHCRLGKSIIAGSKMRMDHVTIAINIREKSFPAYFLWLNKPEKVKALKCIVKHFVGNRLNVKTRVQLCQDQKPELILASTILPEMNHHKRVRQNLILGWSSF